MFTGISTVVLLIAMGIFLLTQRGATKPGKAETFRPQTALEKQVQETRAFVTAALRVKDPDQLRESLDRIDATDRTVLAFEGEAKKATPPWTDDQVGYFLERLNWMQVKALSRSVRDELQAQKRH